MPSTNLTIYDEEYLELPSIYVEHQYFQVFDFQADPMLDLAVSVAAAVILRQHGRQRLMDDIFASIIEIRAIILFWKLCFLLGLKIGMWIWGKQ